MPLTFWKSDLLNFVFDIITFIQAELLCPKLTSTRPRYATVNLCYSKTDFRPQSRLYFRNFAPSGPISFPKCPTYGKRGPPNGGHDRQSVRRHCYTESNSEWPTPLSPSALVHASRVFLVIFCGSRVAVISKCIQRFFLKMRTIGFSCMLTK